MKKLFVVPLLLGGLLQNAGLTATQAKKTTRTPARKSVAKRPPVVDPTAGDNVDGDDLTIRRAAVAGLGPQSGSVVVVDPATGRVLSMVNQRLGLKTGFTPCSTIKLVTSLAALTEHVVGRDTSIFVGRHISFTLTTAIAHSNNQYFNILGTRLGFERVTRYAQMLGLSEKAGFEIPGEQPGVLPAEPPRNGGVGMMTSFGEGITLTPLELAALLSAIANGGTLYYLQYPRTQAEIDQFIPKVKRSLELAPNGIADIRMGMRAAVDYGTARRAGYDSSEPILGKTGTCTDFRLGSHMGWFGSFNDVGHHQLVIVVMLAGSRSTSGPVAAGVAGAIYRNLSGQRYFAADTTEKPGIPDMVSTSPCCSR
jgi:penicillin-binding protein 2